MSAGGELSLTQEEPSSPLLTHNDDERSFHDDVSSESDSASLSLDVEENDRRCGSFWYFYSFLFGNIEPLPWSKFFLLSAVCAIPPVAYILLFTKMGFGLNCFYYLSDHYGQHAAKVAVALLLFSTILYIFDVSYWDSKIGTAARQFSFLLLLIGIVLLVLFMAGDHPYGPIVLFSILTPLFLVLFKMLFMPKKNTRVFVSWLGGPMFFVGFTVGIAWFIWTFLKDENEWNEVTRLADAEEALCEPNFEDHPECKSKNGDVCFQISSSSELVFPEGCDESCTDVFDDCINCFILWVGPLLVSMSLGFLGFFSTFLRDSGSTEKSMINFAKLWVFLLFVMWVAASLNGAGTGVTTTLLALTLGAFVSSAIFLMASFSRADRKAQKAAVVKKMMGKYGSFLDVFRGLLIVALAPVALVYIFLSFLNQCVRRLNFFPCSKTMISNETEEESPGRPAEDQDWVTVNTRKRIEIFRSWDRSKVYTYAIYWGIAFMVLQVIVAQITLLFLSWLIDATSSMSLIAVTGIMFGVGLLMFLLPPVPGVPIYLTMGVVVVAIGRSSLGLVGSMVYVSAVSLTLKLFACAVQQKIIGENLSHYVTVRQFCMINSIAIRSMRLILSERGLGIKKVSILIGGPDWPTSVLCGIMRLDLLPILVGTLPIIVLIVPTVLTGSFTYMASLRVDGSPEFPWAKTVAAVFAAFTALVQLGAMVFAAFYLEKTASTRGDEVDAIPLDQEVKEAEDKAENSKKMYAEVTQWAVVPLWAKCILTLSLATVIASCYMVLFFQDKCFAEYELTSTISKDLEGDWKNLFLPLGRVAILLFLICMMLLYVFTTWAKRKAAKVISSTSYQEVEEDGDVI